MDAPDIPTLETERLRLRPFRLSDFEDYAEMCGDPEVARYLSVCFTREQSWRHLAFVIGHWKLRGYGMWAVEHKETGEFLGRIGFAHPEGWPGCELAWTLARRFWGRGYATEGARAALAHGFTVMNHERVLSLIQPENCESRRLAERLGESLRDRTELAGKEYLVYGIDRVEFMAGEGCRAAAATEQQRLADLETRGLVTLPGRAERIAFQGPTLPNRGKLASDMISEDRR